MSLRYLFIVNGSSNSARIKRQVDLIQSEIPKMFDSYELFFSESRDSAQKKIKSTLDDFDVFVACGGDGTVQSVAEVLNGTTKILGVLPIGSGNDFSKLIGVGRNVQEFLEVLKRGKYKHFDLFSTEDGITLNTFGIGFDGLTNLHASKVKKLPGSIKYVYAAIKALFVADKFLATIGVDHSERIIADTHMILIANGKWEGGTFLVSKDSDPTDGVLELLISNSSNKNKLLYQFCRLALGLDLSRKSFKKISIKSAQISLDKPVQSHSDGEVIQPKSLFTLKIKPSSIKVLIR